MSCRKLVFHKEIRALGSQLYLLTMCGWFSSCLLFSSLVSNDVDGHEAAYDIP
ncbi:hypothetical protein BDN70DRAFT_397343 [Pholiota conissans]|uniref:Uncharacterized protein n=1 Tax=Pholiota conissans TaxID=109636 RepID=A0A9P5YP18_9AGAR|nr:hypothetical protein BDN70DRAFT_397343 [Pholiota conissans]